MIGKILQPTKHLCGFRNGIQEMPIIDGSRGKWRSKTKSRGKEKRKPS